MKELYKTGCSSDKKYVYAHTFTVPYTPEIAFSLAKELVALGKENGAHGCLIDIRGAQYKSSVMDKYKFAYEKASLADLPKNWRYAFIIDTGHNSPKFIETVMKNAGYMFEVFEDEQQAIDWLSEYPNFEDSK